MKAIDYAKASCDTMMRKFEAAKLPPAGRFHYHQGVFLSGMTETYKQCRDERYFNYMRAWVDSLIDRDGNILNFDRGQLDDIMPGVLLYPLLAGSGDVRYKKALDTLIGVLEEFPKNPLGGFWHKSYYPEQMWLDGLYMAGPIMAEYAKRFDKPSLLDEVVAQILLMEEVTRDSATGLWCHAFDYTKSMPWANPETGKSPEFWGRAMGWVVVAVQQILNFMEETHPMYERVRRAARDLLIALTKYQTESGLWCQVVDKADDPRNWTEVSCSCLFTAGLFMAVRSGILPDEYLKYARRGYEGVIDTLKWNGEDLIVGKVCVGTGVGDLAHYYGRPTSENDLHGVGAFLIMCAECGE
ncbi:MAG: glycoside hydrolase family 88 protein [Oscillospiraceae bacterium]|jgi:unsaturated rhamnogalacturonyl hydrolase|nr:glycoside hydrolase family 88 protein [Oscillospiraceae bacterium]